MSFEGIPYIDQNNDAILNLSLDSIRLPFPPSFTTVSDFVNKRESSSRIFRKSPNAFFIYRKAFTNYLTLNNYKLTMIDVSRLVSNYWKNESKEVKEFYAKIAKEIDVELKEKRKHDKKCPVIWKIDKKSKKQKRVSRRNLKNNNNDDSSLTKIKNTAEITFEFQNCSIPVNESDQKLLRSTEEVDSQTSLENSPNSSSSMMEFPGIIQEYNVMNYDNSQSNESEKENYIYTQITQIYPNAIDISPEYDDFNYDGLNLNNGMFQFSWSMNNMNDSCNENLECQQGNGFH